MKYKCPNNPEHTKFTASEVKRMRLSGPSPHWARLDCDECEANMDRSFVKCLSKKEYEEIREGVPEEESVEEGLTCPIMSNRIRAGAIRCERDGCMWWYEMEKSCSVLRIAEALAYADTR